MKATLNLTLAGFVLLASCASTEMYTPDGYLTVYGTKVTKAEQEQVITACKSSYERTESAYYECLRDLVPLALRTGPEFATLINQLNTDRYNVTKGFEAGNISRETTIQTLDKLDKDYDYNGKILIEQYNHIVFARNAREKQLARQRMGMALSQAGNELLRQSSAESKSITCTETVPGTVSCSEW